MAVFCPFTGLSCIQASQSMFRASYQIVGFLLLFCTLCNAGDSLLFRCNLTKEICYRLFHYIFCDNCYCKNTFETTILSARARLWRLP